jgi:hypothetical protein
MQHDGSNGARARSARIRAAHDGEANELESMRRRGAASAARAQSRVSLVARLTSFLGGARARSADSVLTTTVDDERGAR